MPPTTDQLAEVQRLIDLRWASAREGRCVSCEALTAPDEDGALVFDHAAECRVGPGYAEQLAETAGIRLITAVGFAHRGEGVVAIMGPVIAPSE